MEFKPGQLIESRYGTSRGIVIDIEANEIRYILFHVAGEDYHVGKVFLTDVNELNQYYTMINELEVGGLEK